MFRYERVDPKETAKKARALHASPGDVQFAPWQLLPGAAPDGSFFHDAKLVWQKVKPEFYTLCAVLSDDVLQRTLKNYLTTSPQELSGILRKSVTSGDDIFENLHQYTKHTFAQALFDEGVAQVRNPTHPRVKIWLRYLLLDTFARKQVRKHNESRHVLLLHRGVNTAAKVMSEILRLIPVVFEHHPDVHRVDSLVSIAQNSYPLVPHLSMLEINEFSREQLHLQGLSIEEEYKAKGVYDPSKFCRRQGPAGLALDIKDHLSGPSSHKYTDPLVEPKIGCPAMINIENGSPIQKLWNWHIQMAPTIFDLYLQHK